MSTDSWNISATINDFIELHTSLTSEAVLRSPRFGHRKYNRMKKKLKPSQQKFWNRLSGQHNRRVREQIGYMRKSGTLTASEHEYLMEQSYIVTEAEIWRLIIDHIRVNTMKDFNMTYQKQPRKRRKNTTKKR